jgi:hypothetical protein
MDKTKFAATLVVTGIFGTLTVLGARCTAKAAADAIDILLVAIKKD